MKKIVIVFFALLTISEAFAQSHAIALKPDKASIEPNSVFLDAPKYVKNFLPDGHETGTLSTNWIFYTDTVDQQFKYAGIPGTINLNVNGSAFKDTIIGFSERFTSPYNSSTYLDSVQIGFAVATLTANNDNYRLFLSVNNQTVDATNHLAFPGATRIDTQSISYNTLSNLTANQLTFITVPMHHKKVGRTFFITASTPYDTSVDLASQNLIALFGDSVSIDKNATIDTSVQRGLAAGLHYSFYWEITQDMSQTFFYQNFWIAAFVNSSLNGVGDTKLTGNALAQNYPNPVTAQSEISYSLANEGRVSIKVYNALGVEVATLADNFELAGEHQTLFNADKLPSGTYYYTLRAGDFTQTKQMIVTK